jgi:hypothetical protein
VRLPHLHTFPHYLAHQRLVSRILARRRLGHCLEQPSVRRRLLTRHILRSHHSHRDPFPRSMPFELPPAAAPTRRSQGFCCSLVQQYHGPLRLLARHRRRFHLPAYTPSYPPRRGGPYETSRANTENFPTAPPAHTLLCPGAPSISFTPIVQTRHHLDRADRFAKNRLRLGVSPQTLPDPTSRQTPCPAPPLTKSRQPTAIMARLLTAPSEALPPPSATDPAWGRSDWTFTS